MNGVLVNALGACASRACRAEGCATDPHVLYWCLADGSCRLREARLTRSEPSRDRLGPARDLSSETFSPPLFVNDSTLPDRVPICAVVQMAVARGLGFQTRTALRGSALRPHRQVASHSPAQPELKTRSPLQVWTPANTGLRVAASTSAEGVD